jgi:CRP/FNR family transcriptional regulator, cyclic AMP receptor protein
MTGPGREQEAGQRRMPTFRSGNQHRRPAAGVESQRQPFRVAGESTGESKMTDPILSAVQQHPFSQGLTPEHCATLASLARRVDFAEGDLIFQEGDQKHEFFLLLTGRVALELEVQGKPLRVHTLEGGDELGWSAVIVGGGKHFQARALEPVGALSFNGYTLLERCRSDTGFGYKIMHRLLGVVSERLQAARMQVLDMYSPVAKRAGA